MIKKIKILESLLIIMLIFMSCTSNKETFQISISSLKDSDKPHPIIILNNKNNEEGFPKHYYKIRQSDLEKIEKECVLRGKERILKVLLIEVKKNNTIEKYFFNEEEGSNMLIYIQNQTSHYNNESLRSYLLLLQKITE